MDSYHSEEANPYPYNIVQNRYDVNNGNGNIGASNFVVNRFGDNNEIPMYTPPQLHPDYWRQWQENFSQNLQETLQRSFGNIRF